MMRQAAAWAFQSCLGINIWLPTSELMHGAVNEALNTAECYQKVQVHRFRITKGSSGT